MSRYRDVSQRLRGPLAPVLTAFTEDGRLDIDATCRWVDWLITQGIKLFWTTQGTSHFMTLSDKEVMDLTQALAAVTAGRALFIASTPWHWSTRQCQEFVTFAARCQADVVKLQFVYDWEPTDDQIIDHYQAVAVDSPLPLFAYTRGRPGMTSDLLRRILQIPQFIGMKNDSDDYYGQEQYLSIVEKYSNLDEFVVLTGGGLSSVLSSYDYGIRAYGDMTIWYDPQRSLTLYDYLVRGDRQEIISFIQSVEGPLRAYWATFSPGMHWSWGHAVLEQLGFFPSRRLRFPLRSLDIENVEQVRAFLMENNLLSPTEK